jgi:hypothetical protein
MRGYQAVSKLSTSNSHRGKLIQNAREVC